MLQLTFDANKFFQMHQKEEADACLSNLVFDVNNKDKPPWRCCSKSLVPRSEIIILVQVNIIVVMIILCFTMLFLFSESCEEKSIWIALLSSLIGYILTNPKL